MDYSSLFHTIVVVVMSALYLSEVILLDPFDNQSNGLVYYYEVNTSTGTHLYSLYVENIQFFGKGGR